jgi:hypothetical protein
MLSKRDLQLISAMSQARGVGGDSRAPRRGCLPKGCLLPILFFICGLPIDILLVAKALGLAR